MWRSKSKVTILAVGAACIYFVMLLMLVATAGNIIFMEGNIMNTLIKVVPSKTVLAPNEAFTVDVIIEPAVGIAGAQFDLDFNPQAVQVGAITEGDLFKQGGAQTYFMQGMVDNTTGQIKNVVSVVLGAGQSVSTPGTMVTISCTAVGAGKASAFVLKNVIVGDPSAVALPLESPVITQIQVASSVDLNLDGSIDMADVLVLVAVFGATGTPGFRREDIDKDGKVDILDLILVGQNFT